MRRVACVNLAVGLGNVLPYTYFFKGGLYLLLSPRVFEKQMKSFGKRKGKKFLRHFSSGAEMSSS